MGVTKDIFERLVPQRGKTEQSVSENLVKRPFATEMGRNVAEEGEKRPVATERGKNVAERVGDEAGCHGNELKRGRRDGRRD